MDPMGLKDSYWKKMGFSRVSPLQISRSVEVVDATCKGNPARSQTGYVVSCYESTPRSYLIYGSGYLVTGYHM